MFEFILMFLGLLVPIFLFSWLMKRWTGYSPLDRKHIRWNNSEPTEIELLKRHYVMHDPEQHKQREKKDNPHFDALVDAEWKATKHLEESSSDAASASDEIHTFSELLEPKNKKL